MNMWSLHFYGQTHGRLEGKRQRHYGVANKLAFMAPRCERFAVLQAMKICRHNGTRHVLANKLAFMAGR